MTVTKLVRLNEDYNRDMYVSQIDKLKYAGLRVHGIISSKYIFRSVDDARELQRIEIYYQTQ